jgi:hypothetical protein
MRYVVGFVCLMMLAVLPLSVSAQGGEEAASAEPSAEQPEQSTGPTRTRLERWHPEAFSDPSKLKSMPVYVDPLTGAPLAVPEGSPAAQMPTAPRSEEQQRRRRIGIGVGVSIGVVALVLGVAVGVSASKIKREGIFSSSGAVIVF